MADPLITEILTLGQSLGRHPARLILAEEGALAARVTDNRVAISRRGAHLAELQAADLVHFDLKRINEVIANDPVLPEDLAGAQLHAEFGAEPHEDETLFAWLLAIEPALRVATHVHPVIVDQITASPRARQFADRRTVHNEVLALGSASLLINYAEPGLPLTREIQKKMILWRDRNKSVPASAVILVQNHGVIVLGESALAMLRTIDALLKYAELFAGASLLGGPVFLTPQAITQIEQHHRRMTMDRQWLLPLGVLIGYAILMATNVVRHSLLDGLRAIRRYPRLWGIPAGLGLCYALFHAGLILFFYTVLPIEQQPAFGWRLSWSIPPWSPLLRETHSLGDWLTVFSTDPRCQVLREACLNGLESIAGLFNNVVTTFPLSAIAALLLLFNWEDHHSTLRNALRKRFGRAAWLVHAGIVLCALSAIVAPVLFGPSLIYLNRTAPGLLLVRWSALIDWLSSLFAYLFGVGVQVYLILIVYTWLRGLNWTPVHLMDLAIRRFSFVVKWAAIVMAVSSLFIDVPRVCALLFRFDDPLFLDHTLAYTDWVARPLLALFLIFFSTMQITLTFHSETLGKAMTQHWQFLRRFAWQLLWFLLLAAIHLLALAFLDRWLVLGFGGETTSAALIWSLIYPLLAAFLAAWLLSSWVSLYKRCETGRLQAPDWIPF